METIAREVGEIDWERWEPTVRANLLFVIRDGRILLIRKKRLILDSSVDAEGEEWLQLSEREDKSRTHWVVNPQLSDGELENVRDRLGELLQMNV